MTFNDPDVVAREYADETRFTARRAAFSDFVEGPTAEDLAIEAMREIEPSRVLEVGCGLGEFAQRVSQELPVELTAVGVRNVVDHPVRDDAVEFAVSHRKILNVANASVHPSLLGDLHHTRREIALGHYFASVERRDANGIVRFPDRDSLHGYLTSPIRGAELAERVPPVEKEFVAQSRQPLFVATKA